jgi:hypothetical protein
VIHTHRYAALLPLPLAMINDDAAATTAVPRIVIPTTDSVAFVFGSARSGRASSARPSSSPTVPQRPRSTLTAAQLTRHSRGAMDLRAYVAAKKTPKGFVPLRDLKPRQCRCFARAPFALTDRSRSRLAVSRYAPTQCVSMLGSQALILERLRMSDSRLQSHPGSATPTATRSSRRW